MKANIYNKSNKFFQEDTNIIQKNIIDIITQQVTNNMLQYINNNKINKNTSSYNNLYNNKISALNEQLNWVSNANNIKPKNNIKNKMSNERIEFSLKKRKDNLNKFIYNYRKKHYLYNNKSIKIYSNNNTEENDNNKKVKMNVENKENTHSGMKSKKMI